MSNRNTELVKLLRTAGAELNVRYKRPLLDGPYADTHELGTFILNAAAEIKEGNMHAEPELRRIFAPTGIWDDANGPQQIANQVLSILDTPPEPELKIQEFQCRICLHVGESTIHALLEEEFPSLKWEEGDSSWDKIRVWGVSPDGIIVLISVYRYESPGPFKLTIRLRAAAGIDLGDTYISVRDRVLNALGAQLWKPLEPQPVGLVKSNEGFPAAYEFKSDLTISDIENVLNDAEFWYWNSVYVNRISEETCLQASVPFRSLDPLEERVNAGLPGYKKHQGRVVRIFGTEANFKIEVGHWEDDPGWTPTCEQIHETVQNTILPAIRARDVRAADITPVTAKVSLPELIQLVRSGEGWHERSGAAELLGEMGKAAEPAIPVLVGALQDGAVVRREAARALGRIGPAAVKAVPALVEALWDSDESVYTAALDSLELLGSMDAALPKLIVMLKTAKNPRRRNRAAKSLGDLGAKAKEAVPALIQSMMGDAEYQVRLTAVHAIGAIGPVAREATPALEELLVRGNKDLEERARRALERVRQGTP